MRFHVERALEPLQSFTLDAVSSSPNQHFKND
jgi:hypothetical protein